MNELSICLSNSSCSIFVVIASYKDSYTLCFFPRMFINNMQVCMYEFQNFENHVIAIISWAQNKTFVILFYFVVNRTISYAFVGYSSLTT